jgi:hypothetical protein
MEVLHRDLDNRTLVFDRSENREVMWIDKLLALPIGAEIELDDSGLRAKVVSVRLVAGTASRPMVLRLDVEAPFDYWRRRFSG